MKTIIKLSVAMILSVGATTQARSPMMCTQIAGVVQHKSTGECRSFRNGCQLSELVKAGFVMAEADSCQSAREFRSLAVVEKAETSIMPSLPSTRTMICEGQNVNRSPIMHTVRLTVITGRSLATSGAMVEVTQTATTAKFQPAAVLANIRTEAPVAARVTGKEGVYYENMNEQFQLFIPELQPLDTPYSRAFIKLGNSKFNARCRTVAY